MLSPPPSPLPPLKDEVDIDYFHQQQQQLQKSSVGRRYTLAILLIPLLLILLTIASTSRISPLFTSSHFAFPSPIPPFPIPSHSPSLSKRDSPSSVPTVPSAPSTATGIVPTPFPEPFDLSLSWNFSTTSCQNYFLNFTQADSFRRCRPFSFLLGTSSKFTDVRPLLVLNCITLSIIQAETNLTLLNDIIWGTCNTVQSGSDCQNIMKSYGSDLQTQCKTELQQNTLLVQQALIGFQLYNPMRQVGCLVNNSTNTYCFLEAVANPSPSDLYFYQLPYGNLLPNNTVPSCSPCIKTVLSIYGQVVAHPPSLDLTVAQNASTPQLGTQSFVSQNIPLDNTYQDAANLASQECGSVYVQQTSANGVYGLRSPPFFVVGSMCFFFLIFAVC